MATKDYSLPLKSKQDFIFNSNGQYKNFNLKQKNSSNAFSESSKNVSSENRKVLNYDFANNNYSKTQKQSHSWNKATKNLSPTFGFIDGFKKESGGKISCSSSISNSTLSLHIEAYENSTVSGLFDGTKKSIKQNGLIQGNAKQLFTDFESVIQNPFEFPRQQENVKAKTPKVAQYTASQRLFNPNQLVTPPPNQMNQINSQVDEEPDFSVFQEPPNVQSFVASPLPSTSASRVFNRLRCGSRINKRRSKQITNNDIPSLPNTQSTNDDIDENFDDDNDGPDDVFDDFSPAPVITEKKEKSLTRWIFEEILAFIICLIYLAGFNVLLKTFL